MPRIRRIYRAYFNRHREFPQVWSIDEGTQASEINVIGYIAHPGCEVLSRYNGEKPNNDSPSAWIEIRADHHYIVDGIVHFSVYPADGRP